MTVRILVGDVFERLRSMPDESVHCVVTSPPYWGLRSYLDAEDPAKRLEIGLEPTLGEHLDVLVRVFREIRRVLRKDGTCWVNYGDCYATAPNGRTAAETKRLGNDDRTFRDKPFSTVGPIYDPGYPARTVGAAGSKHHTKRFEEKNGRVVAGGYLKPKDLCMVSNRLAIALQEDGWWIRSEIIWYKRNPMPESVPDRPGVAHEKIWMLTKSDEQLLWRHDWTGEWINKKPPAHYVWRNRKTMEISEVEREGKDWMRLNLWRGFDYYYEADAVRTELKDSSIARLNQDIDNQDGSARANGGVREDRPMKAVRSQKERGHSRRHAEFNERWDNMTKEEQQSNGANLKNVWEINIRGYKEAHFATFPPDLPERCIKAGCPPKGVVLDPFGGAGTTALVADRLEREAIIIELNRKYANMAEKRLREDNPFMIDVKMESAEPRSADPPTSTAQGKIMSLSNLIAAAKAMTFTQLGADGQAVIADAVKMAEAAGGTGIEKFSAASQQAGADLIKLGKDVGLEILNLGIEVAVSELDSAATGNAQGDTSQGTASGAASLDASASAGQTAASGSASSGGASQAESAGQSGST